MALVLPVEFRWIRRRMFRGKVREYSKVVPPQYALKDDPRNAAAPVFGQAVVKAIGPGFRVELSVDESILHLTPTKPYRRAAYPNYSIPRDRISETRLVAGKVTFTVDDFSIKLEGYKGMDPQTAVVQGPSAVLASEIDWKTPIPPPPGSFAFREVLRPLRLLGGAIIVCASVLAVAAHQPFLGTGFILGGFFQLGFVGRTMGNITIKPTRSRASAKGAVGGLAISALTATVPYAVIGVLCLLLSRPFRWVGFLAGTTLAISFSSALLYAGVSRAMRRARNAAAP